MREIGRNKGSTAIAVNKSSKSSSCDDGEECDEEVEDHLVANENAIQIFSWRMMVVLKDLAMMQDILKGSGVHPKSGGEITFFSNMV